MFTCCRCTDGISPVVWRDQLSCVRRKVIVLVVLALLCSGASECRPNKLSSIGGDVVGSSQRTTRDAAKNLVVSSAQDENNGIGDDPMNPTQVSVTENKNSKEEKEHDHEGKSYLIYASAIPTVLVFVICVVVIAIKNRFNTDDTLDAAVEGPKKKKKIKPKRNQEVYDTMLAKFKDDKNRKRSFNDRKSSQIRIEGMVSRSPKSLARKHIIIKQLDKNDLAPDGNNSALGQLVQLSTHTFIGNTLIEDMETPGWEDHAKEQARKDLSAQLLLDSEPEENDALLPDDLEDVFRNFGNWEESLI